MQGLLDGAGRGKKVRDGLAPPEAIEALCRSGGTKNPEQLTARADDADAHAGQSLFLLVAGDGVPELAHALQLAVEGVEVGDRRAREAGQGLGQLRARRSAGSIVDSSTLPLALA